MEDYKKVPEYIEADQAYKEVVKKVDEYKAYKEKTTTGVANALIKLAAQLNEAESVAKQLGREVAAEEIHNGKSTQKTVEKYDKALNEVTRIKKTLNSINDSSGISLYELEKKKNALLFELEEEKENKARASSSVSFTSSKKFIDKIKEMTRNSIYKQDELIKQINEIDSIIAVIKENSSGKPKFNADSGLLESAKTVFDESIKAYKTRMDMRDKLREKLEKNREEIERLKEENNIYQLALPDIRPEALADLLYSCEIDIALWPEIFERRNMGYDVKHRIFMEIRDAANN